MTNEQQDSDGLVKRLGVMRLASTRLNQSERQAVREAAATIEAMSRQLVEMRGALEAVVASSPIEDSVLPIVVKALEGSAPPVERQPVSPAHAAVLADLKRRIDDE
jgi:hypothetical protein